ncbi:hypothetical protein ANANG_G00026060 [Anguilla anguilla]|uniref:Fucolectin tachylectin-4 pentraxin-1 domain-containing protein n=1 Tax=Anguilla anguilla TaxID=7936 RepID=A0A9D3S7V8_ANGAN|nr:hypothetical protein ANANG_G00026060 [Anguilla anguilla]
MWTKKNVALGGKATQSERLRNEWAAFSSAGNAIDGNRDSYFYHGSCIHTSGGDNPWWRVDLLQVYTITSVTITNRGDCCGERISGARILIGKHLKDNGINNPHGRATQSDLLKGEWAAFSHASNAIDGNRDSFFYHGSCTHTSGGDNPWWRVDLLQVYTITSVTITNRGDCCGERISGAQILIGKHLKNNGINNPQSVLIFTVQSLIQK